MTRKDFQLIARVIKESEGAVIDDLSRDGLAEMFADELASTNPAFDRARFLKACGVN